MASLDAESIWQSAFPGTTRPGLYLSDGEDDEDFQHLNDPQNFIRDTTGMNHLQLYALSINAQLALQYAQDEYLDISKEIAAVKAKDNVKNPQKLQDPELFEEHKESLLYGYKYEAPKPVLLQNGVPGLRAPDEVTEREKNDVRYLQEPFQQGGFVPTEKQYKAFMAKNKQNLNPDGWQPVERNGRRLVPVQQGHHDEYNITYVRRKFNEYGEVERPGSADSNESAGTPSKMVDKRLTRTRFGGKKHPPTREVSEAPSIASTPGRKRKATPVIEDKITTPVAKRAKLTDPDRPKHPNQYTKMREAASQAALRAAAGGARDPETPYPIWSQLSAQEKRDRKWTDQELVDCLKQDHTWLHDDPDKSAEWKDKVINGANPVRSYSMLMKWAYWKVEKKDKRPRGKKHEKEGSAPPPESARGYQRRGRNALRDTASASPAPESLINGSEGDTRGNGIRPTRKARSGLAIGMVLGDQQVGTNSESVDESKVEEEVTEFDSASQRHDSNEWNSTPPGGTSRMKREDTGNEITVNGDLGVNEDFFGKRSNTGTPILKKTSPTLSTPTRRSLRSSRRGSS